MDYEKYPELSIAELVIKRHNLVYPLDIFHVSLEFANIKFIALPPGIDGFVIFNNTSVPDVYLSTSSGKQRQAFTLAHEIGHIFIPWHPCTSLPCNVSRADSHLNAIEVEANRFASELLMPSPWLKTMMQCNGTEAALSTLLSNNISIEAACIGIQRSSPFPTITEIFNHRTGKRKPYASSLCPYDFRHKRASDIPNRHVSFRSEINAGHVTISIVELKQAKLIGQQNTAASAKEIFNGIYSSREIEEAKKHWASANGIISALNGQADSLPLEEFFQAAMLRISARDDLSHLSAHPEFSHFVSLRCKELCDRRAI